MSAMDGHLSRLVVYVCLRRMHFCWLSVVFLVPNGSVNKVFPQCGISLGSKIKQFWLFGDESLVLFKLLIKSLAKVCFIGQNLS
jgi:hypothetical protein